MIKIKEEFPLGDRVILKKTKKISTKEISMFEICRFIKKNYKEDRLSPAQKCLVSILNSIYYQKSGVFGFTKKTLKDLIQNDVGWKGQEVPFSSGIYKATIALLINYGFAKKIEYETKKFNKLYLYELTHPEILKELDLDIESQRENAIKFAKRFVFKGSKPQKTEKLNT